MRKSRASRRRRAAALTAEPRPTLADAAASTSQKCAGWLSQRSSAPGCPSMTAKKIAAVAGATAHGRTRGIIAAAIYATI